MHEGVHTLIRLCPGWRQQVPHPAPQQRPREWGHWPQQAPGDTKGSGQGGPQVALGWHWGRHLPQARGQLVQGPASVEEAIPGSWVVPRDRQDVTLQAELGDLQRHGQDGAGDGHGGGHRTCPGAASTGPWHPCKDPQAPAPTQGPPPDPQHPGPTQGHRKTLAPTQRPSGTLAPCTRVPPDHCTPGTPEPLCPQGPKTPTQGPSPRPEHPPRDTPPPNSSTLELDCQRGPPDAGTHPETPDPSTLPETPPPPSPRTPNQAPGPPYHVEGVGAHHPGGANAPGPVLEHGPVGSAGALQPPPQAGAGLQQQHLGTPQSPWGHRGRPGDTAAGDAGPPRGTARPPRARARAHLGRAGAAGQVVAGGQAADAAPYDGHGRRHEGSGPGGSAGAGGRAERQDTDTPGPGPSRPHLSRRPGREGPAPSPRVRRGRG